MTVSRLILLCIVSIVLVLSVVALPWSDEPWAFYPRLVGGALACFVMGCGFGIWAIAAAARHPGRKMLRALEQISPPLPEYWGNEPDFRQLADIADALHEAAARLNKRLEQAEDQLKQRDAVLSSMVEAVLAVDSAQHIISINRAAADLFNIEPKAVQGRSVQHAVRNPKLVEIIGSTLKDPTPVAREIVVQAKGRELVLLAHATGLHNAAGKTIGAVLVLDDVTDLRRLERIRSDFVANVSHELKTPITSIKGFVETLLDGMDDPERSKRFLKIVAKQADRLHAIIEDLLILSRVEQDEQAAEGLLSTGALMPVIQGAAQLCAGAAENKEIRLVASCSPQLRARINGPLLEQGLTNLIDNAIKYSDTGGEVRVEATDLRGEIVISVSDQGCGIPSEHLPRLFERFYRVDKARSRNMGGTGLGLAIVKHIAQTHGGRIDVESKPGAGSTFRIFLPKLEPVREHFENAV